MDLRKEVGVMEIRKYKKIIEQEVTVYVAEDGTEFSSSRDCINYEANLRLEKKIKEVERLRIKELDGVIPFNNDGIMNCENEFRWYDVTNKDDFDAINDIYNNNLTQPVIYPEIICVETYGYDSYGGDAYDYHMTACKKNTEDFWNQVGFKCVIERVNGMKDKSGKEIKEGNLLLIKESECRSGRYFYVESIDSKSAMLYGKRVNKDFTFNRYDRIHNNRVGVAVLFGDEIEVIEPPDKFKESLRTLYFRVDEVLEDFGAIVDREGSVLFRAVKYTNSSYGIVQNRLTRDGTIDYAYEVANVYEDLTYDELKDKWIKRKENWAGKWVEKFFC